MLILTIRTDKPSAEIGLFEDDAQLDYEAWEAHRALAETIHTKISEILKPNGGSLETLGGIVVFQGPGSFTGLRIGLTVANTLAEALAVPIVGSQGDQWIEQGIKNLLLGQNDRLVLPEYGALPNITAPRK